LLRELVLDFAVLSLISENACRRRAGRASHFAEGTTMTLLRTATMAAVIFAIPCVAFAQAPAAETQQPASLASTPAPAAPAAAATSVPEGFIRIPAGTVIQVEFVEVLTSYHARPGQTFALRLVEPIVLDGRTVVGAGAAGGGEVIDARQSGMGGRQGKLVVSGRFVELHGVRARIRGMAVLERSGGENRARDAVNASIAAGAVGGVAGSIVGLFIQGSEVVIPSGARATAKLAVDVDVPATPPPSAAPNAEPIAEPTPEPTQAPVQQANVEGDQ
jgi:hypothetical protein